MTFTTRGLNQFAVLTLVAAGLLIQGCGRDSGFAQSSSVSAPSGGDASSGGGVVAGPTAPTVPTSPSQPNHVMEVAPLWEKAIMTKGLGWTQFAAKMVLTEAPDLMKGTSDIQKFCPSYFHLKTDDKLNFWVYLISAITKYESAFDPASRMRETGLGVDGITKQHVYSEGLLQLSYQDQQNYKFCNEFDWSRDKSLAPTDPRKTILDPIKNLRCGIRILNKVIGRRNMISFDAGHYWSTLMPKHGPVHLIQAMTNQISICQK